MCRLENGPPSAIQLSPDLIPVANTRHQKNSPHQTDSQIAEAKIGFGVKWTLRMAELFFFLERGGGGRFVCQGHELQVGVVWVPIVWRRVSTCDDCACDCAVLQSPAFCVADRGC